MRSQDARFFRVVLDSCQRQVSSTWQRQFKHNIGRDRGCQREANTWSLIHFTVSEYSESMQCGVEVQHRTCSRYTRCSLSNWPRNAEDNRGRRTDDLWRHLTLFTVSECTVNVCGCLIVGITTLIYCVGQRGESSMGTGTALFSVFTVCYCTERSVMAICLLALIKLKTWGIQSISSGNE